MNKRIWNIVFVSVAVALGIAFSIKPWRVYVEQRSLARAQELEMERAERGRTRLVEQKARLDSGPGREELARRYGYMKPGEIPIGD